MERKKTLYNVIIGIVLLIVFITAISFAFMGSRANVSGNINVLGNIAEGELPPFNITFSESKPLALNLALDKLSSISASNDYTNYIEDSSNVTINLNAQKEDYPIGLACEYNIYYDPITTYSASTGAQSAGLNELVIRGTDGIDHFDDISLDGITSKTKIYSGSTTLFSNITWTFNMRFYNLLVDQASAISQGPSGNILIEMDNCTFPKAMHLATYIKNNIYTEDGVNGLYYHDGQGNYTNANLEIGDNSYRYAGADASVNNYVCFDGDDCTKEENLFRIISVDSDNKIKIIKVTSTSNRYWNGRAGYIAGARAEDVAQSLWNGSSFLNIWAIKKADGSYYISYTNSWLNGEYLVSLGENGKLVETTTWSVAGLTWAEIQANNAKGIYDIETNNKAIYDAKVGLMYVHEYMYAALPTYWSKVGYNSSSTSYDYRSSVGNNWMWSSGVPWTISRARDGEWDAYRIAAAGNPGVSNVDSSAQPVRPAFVLSSSTRVINADVKDIGTKTNPMIIGE